jgi:hypothetical protein
MRLDLGVAGAYLDRTSLNTSDSKTATAADIGALLNLGSRGRVGASVLNANQPSINIDGVSDQAPRAFKLGYAGSLPFGTFAIDGTQRGSSLAGSSGFSLASGMEHWWSRPDLGAAALRSGLNLGGRGELFTGGFALQRGGAELSYAIEIPLSIGHVSHLLAFHFYFSGKEPQDVYQQLLRQEFEAKEELRKLIDTQDDTLAKLREDLLIARIETEKLKLRVEGKAPLERDADADEKLKRLLELQEQLRSDLRKAEGQRRVLVRKSEAPTGFSADWAAYSKLKSSGAPPSVLADSLVAMISKYRGTGTDLSDAYSEYLRIQGAP